MRWRCAPSGKRAAARRPATLARAEPTAKLPCRRRGHGVLRNLIAPSARTALGFPRALVQPGPWVSLHPRAPAGRGERRVRRSPPSAGACLPNEQRSPRSPPTLGFSRVASFVGQNTTQFCSMSQKRGPGNPFPCRPAAGAAVRRGARGGAGRVRLGGEFKGVLASGLPGLRVPRLVRVL